MPPHPDRQWNHGGRELNRGQEMLDEAVYCVTCGNIFVRKGTERGCPTCRLAEVIEDIADGDPW